MPTTPKSFSLRTSFKPILSASRKSISKSNDDTTSIIVAIAVLLFIIIGGTIIYNSYNREKFTNPPNTLVYLYMTNCGHCQEFTKTWEDIETDVKSGSYNFQMKKYNLNDDEEAKKLSTKENINYAPAIILVTPKANYIYNGNREKALILKWVVDNTKV